VLENMNSVNTAHVLNIMLVSTLVTHI